MNAAVSGVPAEAMVEFARGVYGAQWLMLNPKVQAEILADYANGLAAALPSLREQVAAEVLGPVRAVLDDYSPDPRTNSAAAVCARIRAALPTPVQAAEEAESE